MYRLDMIYSVVKDKHDRYIMCIVTGISGLSSSYAQVGVKPQGPSNPGGSHSFLTSYPSDYDKGVHTYGQFRHSK